MNKDELLKFCLINDDSICDYPFKDRGYQNTPVIRNKINKKWFALIFELNNVLYINLKCAPCDSWVLQDQYEYITPAWHMNKKHWIKVEVQKASKKLLKTLIKNSFNLSNLVFATNASPTRAERSSLFKRRLALFVSVASRKSLKQIK